MIEQLTDEERDHLGNGFPADSQIGGSGRKALRIIDAHAADRAALVAKLDVSETKVAELTRERDEARANVGFVGEALTAAESEVTRLTEALAAAQRKLAYELGVEGSVARAVGAAATQRRKAERFKGRALTAEARVRELTEIERTMRSSEANKRIAAAIDAIASARLATGSVEAAWAEQALRALRG